ncbi:hypothetical protein PLICRDRAFT_104445 [Plicaturopsis crispa FD-325 SS-3]|nr:hypothetical protein PLICRDRAFT_104445 [Plicaturopsis crispa FD-325 SS-3]
MREIRRAAKATTRALEDNGLRCCLFGSAACSVYGISRTPNDIDMLVLTRDYDAEQIKALIVETNPRFYLTNSRNPRNTYRILHFALDASGERECKVDILVPGGELNLPRIPPGQINYATGSMGAPAMPLLALLLLKLQGWDHHRAHYRPDMRAKQWDDIDDIDELLAIAVDEHALELRTERWMPKWFVNAAKTRVRDYVEEDPDSAYYWSELGFDV